MLAIKKLFAKILALLKDPIIYREFSSNGGVSLPAHGAGNLTVYTTTPAGYTPLTVVHTRTNGDVWANYANTGTFSTYVVVWLRNPQAVSASITSVTVGVLYKKNV